MEWDVVVRFSVEGSLLLQASFFPYPYPEKPLDPDLDALLFPDPPVLALSVPVRGGSPELDGIRFQGKIQGPEIRPDLIEEGRDVGRSLFSGPKPRLELEAYRFRFQDREEAFAFARPLLESLVREWNRTLARNSGERAVRGFLRNWKEEPERATVALLRLVKARLALEDWTLSLRYGPEQKLWEWGKGMKRVLAEVDPATYGLLFG